MQLQDDGCRPNGLAADKDCQLATRHNRDPHPARFRGDDLMTDNPRRRLADHISGSPTFIGAGSALTGNLECGGDLVVAGSVNGDSTVRGSFTLSEGGRWEGRISAANAVVSGVIEGTLAVAEKLEIRETARLRGAVSARTIAVARGAVIEGDMAVTSGAPVVHYEEKRKG
jgi:cytoskeletal protein CcmA (bactofilin family)